MSKPRISIVGLGAIGKAIGQTLCAVGGQLEVMGHDRDPAIAREAQRLGAVTRVHWNLVEACDGADVVIIAIPLQDIRATLHALASDLKPGCLVMDTANLKLPVLAWADEVLPEQVSFVGGDPIVNKHTQYECPSDESQSHRSDLLKGALFCLSPSVRASAESIHLASDVVRLLEAKPYFLDAAEHDGLVAGVEHLPAMLALSLMRALSVEPSWRDIRKMGGPLFEDTARVLSQDAATLVEALSLNRDNVTRLLDNWVEVLYGMREMLGSQDSAGLQQITEAATTAYQHWLKDRGVGLWEKPQGPEIPPGGGFLGRMLGVHGRDESRKQS